MSSYLLYEPNYAIRAFTTAFELKFHIFDSKGKIVQNVNFLFISQNNDLSLKLNLINMSLEVCSISKTAPRILSYWNFTQIETIGFTLKNAIFNGNSFAKFETSIRFVVSKRVWEWSQILIPNPDWPCT